MSNPLILLFFLSALITPSISGDTLTPPQRLTDGQTLVSAGGSFALGFFSPPGTTNRYVGIWYNKVSIQTVVWVANRQNPIADHTGILSISGDGGLVITNPNSTVVWSAPASGTTNPVAQLLDSGNLVVRDAAAADPLSFQWQSFDHPTDTLLPGMKLGWNLTSGLNRNITAWTSDSDPSPAPYTLAMDARGDPQIFLWAGVTRTWRTGPWDGLRFTGIPDMATYSTFSFDFVANEEEVYYAFHTAVVSRLIVNQTGQTQRLVWIEASRSWNLFWFAPKDQCDSLSQCGPYGLCDPNDSPICECLQGFDPKFPANWALRDMSGGCVRRTPLDCRNGTDGFVAVTGAKLPDSSSAAVDRSMGLDDCRAACLANCSCKAYASANISGDGSGCVIWTADITDLRVYTFGGQNLYVRVAAADLGSTTDGSHDSASAVVGIVVGAVVSGCLLLGGIGYCMWKKKKNKKRRSGTTTMGGSVSSADKYNDESARDRELPLLDLDTIAAATDNFSLQNKLGEGGFGPVYKGKLSEGQDIAVKRLAKTSLQGLDEFKNEVMLIAKLQHRNLVRLLGCCVQAEERMLVYEYMHNKSLDIFLFDKAKRAKLDWKTRYNIILGIARGLLYLHQDSRFRIIHRDLKASNILLDEVMNPKISDFGMARIFGGEESEVNTKKVVGTYGYMSPEYAMDGIFSVKSDVFSFGVLALEIISGKKNTSDYLSGRRQNLLGHAWSLWKEGKGLELVDESMGYSFTMTHEAERCIKVGLLCVQEHPEDRPKMDSVVLMLGSEGASRPSPKQPGFVATKGIAETDSSSSKQESLTINEITVTVLEGR